MTCPTGRPSSPWLIALALSACAGCSAEATQVADSGAVEVEGSVSDAGANEDEGDASEDADDAGSLQPDAAADTSVGDAALPRGQRVLFVGNSFTSVNDVPAHYRELVSDLIPRAQVEQVAPGGYLLAQHAADARSDGSALARFLRTGTAAETAFDAVVLQEQSQLGGFKAKSKDRLASIAAASELAMLAAKVGAVVVLYETWGYERGDPPHELDGYGTFTSMQDALDAAYVGVAAMLREKSIATQLAPVGGGFRLVFEDVTRAGGDPLAEGSDFDALYEPDGIHPSLRGAYLGSCIIAAAITGVDARSLGDEPTLGPELSRHLRDVCARAGVDPRWHVPTVLRANATFEGDGAGFANFGATVTLSGDASHLVIGERRYPAPAGGGTAWVYARQGPLWTLEAKWEGLAMLSSIALNADATLALVGPPSRPLQRVDGTWTQGAPLSQGPSTMFMRSDQVALSADGTRALVGELPGGTEMVSARVFVQRAQGWEEEAALRGTTPDGSGARLAFDRSGERALVGSRVFARTAEGWSLEATLPGFGSAVALSGDGRHAALASESEGRVSVFARDGEQWVEQAVLRGPLWSRFAVSVALSHDGRRIVVGHAEDTPVVTAALRGDSTGSVQVYELHEGAFRQAYLLVPDVLPGTIAPYDFATATDLSEDGTIAVGAAAWEKEEIRQGRAYTFVLP
jgi:hypothetical protein